MVDSGHRDGDERRLRALLNAGWVLVLATALTAGEAGAFDQGELEEAFGRGRLNVGLSFGYGHGFERAGDPQDDVRMLAVVPRTGIGLTNPLGGEAWYRGSLDLALEPQLFGNFQRTGGFAGGAALLVRYHLLSEKLGSERLVPFFSAGGGVIGVDFDGRNQDDGFNFILQAGGGTHWMLTPKLAITFDARWHHISNADLGSPNEGIDDFLLLTGVTMLLR